MREKSDKDEEWWKNEMKGREEEATQEIKKKQPAMKGKERKV